MFFKSLQQALDDGFKWSLYRLHLRPPSWASLSVGNYDSISLKGAIINSHRARLPAR